MLDENESGRKQGIRSGHSERIYCSTWTYGGHIFFDNELLMPGENTTTHLFFEKEVPISQFVHLCYLIQFNCY